MKAKIRRGVLLGSAIAFISLAVKAWIMPSVQTPVAVPVSYAETVSLSHWQSAGHTAIETPSYETISGRAHSAYRYRYESLLEETAAQPLLLSIEVVHLTETDGDLKTFIREQAGDRSFEMVHHENQGYYNRFTTDTTSQLVACVNPRGGATVTADQFQRNRLRHDWQPSRLLSWAIGTDTLSDNRCLLSIFTLSHAEGIDSTDAYERLEAAWIDWTTQQSEQL